MKTIYVLVAVVAIVAVIGIASVAVMMDDDSDDGRDTITVSMAWEKDIVEDIVGDNYKVVTMMGANVSPHEAYSVPSNILDLYTSVLFFKIGTGVEWETAFFDDVQKDIPSSVKIVDISKSIIYDALPSVGHDHEHTESYIGEGETSDPHIWTSPAILKKIAKLITDTVSEMDPENAAEYQANYEEYSEDVGEIDSEMDELAALLADHTHVGVWHPAWQYFLSQYASEHGADIHMIAIESEGEKTAAEAISILFDEGIDTIYVSITDEGYENRSALEESNINVCVVNPTAEDMLEELSKFIELLKQDQTA